MAFRANGLTMALAATAVLPTGATAFPTLEGEIPFEIQIDSTIDAEDENAEITDAYATVEPALSFSFSPNLSLEAGVVFEPVADPKPGEDRAFEDAGAYVETLFIHFETERFSVFGGKINPAFGIAWDLAPGIYGTDFAEDYELTERIGFGGSLTFGSEAAGSHTVTATTFFADTSDLSRSAFKDRGPTRKSDGGVSNTEDFSSFSVAFDGEVPALLPGFNYHFGAASQEAGAGDTKDEFALAIGLNGSFALSQTIALEPIAEYVRLTGAEGADQTRDYLTVGASVLRGPWNLAASHTTRTTDPEGAPSLDDALFQISVGYAFENGLALDAGYRFAEEDASDAHTLGVLLTYTVEL